jgi:hypothetical protein
MKPFWLRLLLLATFVFWATGTAKFAHEQLEHHGKDASLDDNDDDDDLPAPAVATAAQSPTPPQDQPKSHHPCPVCQMLGAMTVDRSTPPTLPQISTECIAILVIADRQAPALFARFTPPARGPPMILSASGTPL